MSEPKKIKISAGAVSASGKLRSPGSSPVTPPSKQDKKTAKPKRKPAANTSKQSASPKHASVTTVASESGLESIPVAKIQPQPSAPSPLVAPKLSTLSGTASKETIYVDIDDEITAIIEKLQRARGTIVALVLPKRAVVMQSIVNMRLLKRTAEQAGKHLVLVTGEKSLLPLAGLVGVHIADTPSSKPVIPPTPERLSDEPENIDETLDVVDNSGGAEDFDAAAAADTPVGDLAGVPTAPPADQDEVIIDDAPEDPEPAELVPATPVKKDKKLLVPNFQKFRLYAFLGILAFILLIIGLVVATKVMPRATVSIKTDSQRIASTLNLTLDTAAKTVDTTTKVIPAMAQTTPKTGSQQVAATGQQNNGTKASGSVKMATSICSLLAPDPEDIPAGSSVSSNGHTYITQDTASFSYAGRSNGCLNYTSNSVDIVALRAGADANLASGSSFAVKSGVTGTGSANGGTDNIVKIVNQSDIDSAKSKLATQDTAQLKQDLAAALQAKGLLAIPSTFVAGDPQLTTSVQAGAAADSVTVTAVTPYTMLGIKQSDLRPMVTEVVQKQIDSEKQKIIDDGISTAAFSQQSAGSPTAASVIMKVNSIAGPELNPTELKQQVAGKKSGDIKVELSQLPGVTDVSVRYSPFWVTVAPKDVQKITIDIAQPTAK